MDTENRTDHVFTQRTMNLGVLNIGTITILLDRWHVVCIYIYIHTYIYIYIYVQRYLTYGESFSMDRETSFFMGKSTVAGCQINFSGPSTCGAVGRTAYGLGVRKPN